jgi:hypothetical protein
MRATANAEKSVRIGPPVPPCNGKLLFQREVPAMAAHGDRSAIGPPAQPPARVELRGPSADFAERKHVDENELRMQISVAHALGRTLAFALFGN